MFYEKLERLCQEKGISLRKLTGELNISNANATFWKNGSIPRKSTIKKLADYFCVPVDYFYDDVPIEPIPATKKEVAPVGTTSRDEQSDYIMHALSSMPKDMLDNIEEICRLYNNDPGTDNQKLVNAIRSLLDLNK